MGFNDEVSRAVNRDAPSVTTEDTLLQAMQLMVDHGLTALLVKSGGEVSGVITDTDLQSRMETNNDLAGTMVLEIMTSCQLITGQAAKFPCVQMDSGLNVQTALSIMNKAGMRHLVIAGEDDTPMAIVSNMDLFRLALES